MPKIELVIFDLDDTLYDEIDYCKSGFHAIAQKIASQTDPLHASAVFDAFWSEFTQGDKKHVFDHALQKLNLHEMCTPETIRNLVNEYRCHEPNISLPPESKEVLNTLKKQGKKLALLSDGFLPAQPLKVKILKIEKFFEKIVYTEELGREHWKPSPKGFEIILKDLNIAPKQALYIGDNAKKDFVAPNKLKMVSVHLKKAHGIHQKSPLSNEDAPQYTITKLPKLIEILKSLES